MEGVKTSRLLLIPTCIRVACHGVSYEIHKTVIDGRTPTIPGNCWLGKAQNTRKIALQSYTTVRVVCLVIASFLGIWPCRHIIPRLVALLFKFITEWGDDHMSFVSDRVTVNPDKHFKFSHLINLHAMIRFPPNSIHAGRRNLRPCSLYAPRPYIACG